MNFDQMPQQPQRPTEQDFENKIIGYMQAKAASPSMYLETIDELEAFARGEGDPDLRDQFYAGWTDEDFDTVLTKLEEK